MTAPPVGLFVADCMSVLRSIPTASVPLIVTDPPYGIGYHSNHYADRNPHAPVANDWHFQIGPVLAECGRVLTDGGALYLFCRWDVQPLWIPQVSAAGLKLKTVIAWVKDNHSSGDLTGCFGNKYETLLFITKGRHKLRGYRYPNVWEFPRVPSRRMVHPTQKPVALLRRAIEASSDLGDVVLDPFAGSGSTGEAARECGRGAHLVEIDRRMAGIAARRLGLPWAEDAPTAAAEPASRTALDVPQPHEWGIHPEELAALVESMRAATVELGT